jgi:signal transduction histidine kinase/CheY-like chemotaxis protein
VETPFTAVLRLGQPVQPSRTLLRRTKDGAVISIDDSAAPIHDEAGKIVGVVMVFRDTTYREQIEENLRQAQKMETVGKLAGGIAHDFNNLLTAILGGCILILRDCKDDALRERVQEIEEAGKRAATLTSQLLTFSRKQVFQPEVFDLRSLAQEMRGLLLRLAGTEVDFKIEVGADPAIIDADRAQIGHMLVNLVVNARDAMADGGLLTLEVENVRLTESRAWSSVIVPPGSYVRLTVTDTGCGMNENTLAHIFEPFFTTKEPGKGTGLGLAMVYGVAQQSQALIGVESVLGEGSAFRIYFPREQRRPEPASSEVSSADVLAPGGGETILLTEDEPTVRKVISAVLSAQGYSILEASDGVEALRIAEQYAGPIHLLLTDVIMPQMSGTLLAEKLGSIRPDTRVLYISGHAAGTIVHDGNLNPGMEFLQKPFTPAALSEKVRSILLPFYAAESRALNSDSLYTTGS